MKSAEQFIIDANEVHNNKYKYDHIDYKNSKTNINITCQFHGIFSQIPANHLRGHGCPTCAGSWGEREIEKTLRKFNLNFKVQVCFEQCRNLRKLPFDFGVYSHKNELLFLIEYQGQQHYEPVLWKGQIEPSQANEQFMTNKTRDKIKKRFCNSKKIPLLEIAYWDFEQIEAKISNFIQKI